MNTGQHGAVTSSTPASGDTAAPTLRTSDRSAEITCIRLALVGEDAEVPEWMPGCSDSERQLVAVVDMAGPGGTASATIAIAFEPDDGRVTTKGWELLEETLSSRPLPTFEDIDARRGVRRVQRSLALHLAGRRRSLLSRLPWPKPVAAQDDGDEDDDNANAFPSLRAAAAALLDQAIDACLTDLRARRTIPSGSREGSVAPGSVASTAETMERYLCVPPPSRPTLNGIAANEYAEVQFIRRLPKDGTKGHLLDREALRYGLTSERFPNGSFVVSDPDGRALNFKWGRSPIASGVSLSLCSYKEATRSLLARAGVPVPKGRTFPAGQFDEPIEFAETLGYPVVCKPVAGLRGIGVVANIRSREELRSALGLIAESEMGGDDFIVEKHVEGEDYRIVVIGGQLVAAVVREPASVTGDGHHTILDLIEYKNRLRLLNPHLRSRPIRISGSMRYRLRRTGLDLLSVPEAGRKVILANSANLSQGGDSREVAGELHPTVRDAALRAVEAVPGLGFCGLDMLMEDHRKPIDEQQATIIELNAHAAIGSAQYPFVGEPRPVAREFFLECARVHGLTIADEPADQLAVISTVRGRVTGVNYRSWMRRIARKYELTGWVENVGEKRVQAFVQGSAEGVSALTYLAVRGPRRAVPTSVRTEHVLPRDLDSFTVRS